MPDSLEKTAVADSPPATLEAIGPELIDDFPGVDTNAKRVPRRLQWTIGGMFGLTTLLAVVVGLIRMVLPEAPGFVIALVMTSLPGVLLPTLLFFVAYAYRDLRRTTRRRILFAVATAACLPWLIDFVVLYFQIGRWALEFVLRTLASAPLVWGLQGLFLWGARDGFFPQPIRRIGEFLPERSDAEEKS